MEATVTVTLPGKPSGMVERAIKQGMPAALLLPLQWLERDLPTVYLRVARHLLQQFRELPAMSQRAFHEGR
jgi:hypothetical protein